MTQSILFLCLARVNFGKIPTVCWATCGFVLGSDTVLSSNTALSGWSGVAGGGGGRCAGTQVSETVNGAKLSKWDSDGTGVLPRDVERHGDTRGDIPRRLLPKAPVIHLAKARLTELGRWDRDKPQEPAQATPGL